MAVVTVEDLLDHSAVQGVEIFRRPRATHAARKEAVTGEQMGVSVWIVDSEDQRPRGGCPTTWITPKVTSASAPQ